jgi:hypothetical protein
MTTTANAMSIPSRRASREGPNNQPGILMLSILAGICILLFK